MSQNIVPDDNRSTNPTIEEGGRNTTVSGEERHCEPAKTDEEISATEILRMRDMLHEISKENENIKRANDQPKQSARRNGHKGKSVIICNVTYSPLTGSTF